MDIRLSVPEQTAGKPPDKPPDIKEKKGKCPFSWKAVKHAFTFPRRGNTVTPRMEQHSSEPQPGPSRAVPADVDASDRTTKSEPGQTPGENSAHPKPAKDKQPGIKKKKGKFPFSWKALKGAFTITGRGSTVTPLVEQHSPEPGPSRAVPADVKAPAPPTKSEPGPIPGNYLTDPEPTKGRFFTSYKKGKLLGSGQFGKVYECTHRYHRQKVAVKILRKYVVDKYTDIPEYSKELPVEVALNVLHSKSSTSQHVVRMHQWFDEPKRRILVFEYPHPCENLEEFVKRHGGRLSEDMARNLIFQAVHGAKHCLDRGVYNSDIKSNNMLVNTETLKLKLIDFGCGSLVDTDFDINQYLGKPAPAKFSKKQRYLAELENVRALGFVLYIILHGYLPCYTPKGAKVKELTFQSGLSKECCYLLKRCLTNNYLLRPSLQQVLEDDWFRGAQIPEDKMEETAVPSWGATILQKIGNKLDRIY